jgi:hypothetical protein
MELLIKKSGTLLPRLGRNGSLSSQPWRHLAYSREETMKTFVKKIVKL